MTQDALRVARSMIDAGIPVFAASPCPGQTCGRKGHESGKFEYDLPVKWQLTVPSHVWLERWQPGWALAAVGGHVADFLDEDPRHGGEASIAALESAGQMPRVFGVQATASGGRHYVISPLRERETNSFMPGLDYQGGRPDGRGRAFVWIAPTVRRSKVDGSQVEYRWLQEPDLDYLREFDSDDSIEGLRDRILARKPPEINSRDRAQSEVREFTEEEARNFCLNSTLATLRNAERGGIEDAANAAACQLSHFVPSFWSEEFAFTVLSDSMPPGYDPGGPSEWTVEKFHDVIAGVDGRAPDDWVAVRKADVVVVEPDDVDRLIAEMLTPSQIRERPRPKPLIKGLLNMDSETWMIGAPGSKKSFVALDMGAHVARGQEWQGFKVTKADVLIIVAEGVGGTGQRIEAWEKTYGPMPDNMKLLPRPVQAKDAKAWATLVEACRRLQPGLIVIDTQARSTVGLEENSATEMGIYTEAVRAAREATGACVLTVHHTGRKGGDARGSSAIDGAQGSELKVESKGLTGVLITEKQKDLVEQPPVPLRFEVVEIGLDDDGDPVTSLVLVADAFKRASGEEAPPVVEEWEKHHGTVQVQILKALRDHAGITGLTEDKVRGIVAERWWDGQYHKTAKGALRPSTWGSAWTRVREKVSASGDPLVVGVGGARWILDPLAFESMTKDTP